MSIGNALRIFGVRFEIENEKLNNAINCLDTFYELQYNKVFTVSSLIDQYKRGGGRSKFIGVKDIADNQCTNTTNNFPVNEGVKNFDLLYFLFSIVSVCTLR